MSYAEDNLLQGEQLIIKAKVNVIAFVRSIIVAIILAVVGSIVIPNVGGFFLGLLIGGIFVVIEYIKMKSLELAITNKKVIGKVGVILTRSLDAYLDRIDNISITDQGFLGKVFGYACIQINTTSGMLRFPGITNCKEVKDAAMIYIEQFNEAKMIRQAQYTASEISKYMGR